MREIELLREKAFGIRHYHTIFTNKYYLLINILYK